MEEYARCGAMIQEDLNEASLILGVKQVWEYIYENNSIQHFKKDIVEPPGVRGLTNFNCSIWRFAIDNIRIKTNHHEGSDIIHCRVV